MLSITAPVGRNQIPAVRTNPPRVKLQRKFPGNAATFLKLPLKTEGGRFFSGFHASPLQTLQRARRRPRPSLADPGVQQRTGCPRTSTISRAFAMAANVSEADSFCSLHVHEALNCSEVPDARN